MNAIWKYPLDERPTQTIKIPAGAVIVRVAWQDSEFGRGPMLWAHVEDTMTKVPRTFHVLGTGDPFPSGVYVGSFEAGPLVMHVIEAS